MQCWKSNYLERFSRSLINTAGQGAGGTHSIDPLTDSFRRPVSRFSSATQSISTRQPSTSTAPIPIHSSFDGFIFPTILDDEEVQPTPPALSPPVLPASPPQINASASPTSDVVSPPQSLHSASSPPSILVVAPLDQRVVRTLTSASLDSMDNTPAMSFMLGAADVMSSNTDQYQAGSRNPTHSL